MGFDMNWTQSYAANKNAQQANQNATNAAIRAAQLAEGNGNLIVKVAEMVAMNKGAIDEMRSWETDRFNTMIDGFHKVLDKMDEQNNEIQELKAQVAGLQRKLYEQEQRNKDVVNNCPYLEQTEP